MSKGDAEGFKAETPDVNFLTNIDFSQIDEMDPNLFNGHKVGSHSVLVLGDL